MYIAATPVLEACWKLTGQPQCITLVITWLDCASNKQSLVQFKATHSVLDPNYAGTLTAIAVLWLCACRLSCPLTL